MTRLTTRISLALLASGLASAGCASSGGSHASASHSTAVSTNTATPAPTTPALTDADARNAVADFDKRYNPANVPLATLDMSASEAEPFLGMDVGNAKTDPAAPNVPYTRRALQVWVPQSMPASTDQWFAAVSNLDSSQSHDREFEVFHRGTTHEPWKRVFAAPTMPGHTLPAPAPGSAPGTVQAADTAPGATGLCTKFAQAYDATEKTATPGGSWNAETLKGFADQHTDIQKSVNALGTNGVVDFTSAVRKGDLGPVWHTADGGTLVPCSLDMSLQTQLVTGTGHLTVAGGTYLTTGKKETTWRVTKEKYGKQALLYVPPPGKGQPGEIADWFGVDGFEGIPG